MFFWKWRRSIQKKKKCVQFFFRFFFHILRVVLFRFHREQNFTSYAVLNIILFAWTVLYMMDSLVPLGDREQNFDCVEKVSPHSEFWWMNELIKQTKALELVIVIHGMCHAQIECSTPNAHFEYINMIWDGVWHVVHSAQYTQPEVSILFQTMMINWIATWIESGSFRSTGQAD